MRNWEWGPEDNDPWEDRACEAYQEYLEGFDPHDEDADIMSFEKFRNKMIDEAAEYAASMDEGDYEEAVC